MMSSIRKLIPTRDTTSKNQPINNEQAELQTMLPSVVTIAKNDQPAAAPKQEGICLMTESPFRILRVSIFNFDQFP